MLVTNNHENTEQTKREEVELPGEKQRKQVENMKSPHCKDTPVNQMCSPFVHSTTFPKITEILLMK